MRTTPLVRDEVIPISNTALLKVAELKDKESLLLGHLAQFTHDECFQNAGWKIIPSEPRALYDRELVGSDLLQDDKIATFMTQNGKLSLNHTITHDEYNFWVNRLRSGLDTIIQSFEFTDNTYSAIRYKGAISFRLLYAARDLGIRAGISSYFFNRELAYTFNLKE